MKLKLTALTMLSAALLQGCNHIDDGPPGSRVAHQFQVEVTNLAHNQTIAPLGVVLHRPAFDAFVLGAAASTGLELLAEGGDNSQFLSDAKADHAVLKTAAGTAAIAPGGSESFTVKGAAKDPHLSLAGMLVNTNDGFVALNGADISQLKKGDDLTLYAKIYDAGSEGNSEAAADLPGQGGEGFNADRNDRDFVAVHAGVVGLEDGLATSALDSSFRFDNPGMRVVVTRLK